jgi:hypothetical protein
MCELYKLDGTKLGTYTILRHDGDDNGPLRTLVYGEEAA